MTREEIKSAVKASPFRPFSIRLADGTDAIIPTADHGSISPSGRTLVVFADDGAVRLIDTALILQIETKEAA